VHFVVFKLYSIWSIVILFILISYPFIFVKTRFRSAVWWKIGTVQEFQYQYVHMSNQQTLCSQLDYVGILLWVIHLFADCLL